jgi:hypothetical protein
MIDRTEDPTLAHDQEAGEPWDNIENAPAGELPPELEDDHEPGHAEGEEAEHLAALASGQ